MPSRLPRVALTLPEDLKAVLDDLAEAMEKPTARVIVELLREMAPTLQQTAKMIRLASAGNRAGVKRVLTHMVGDQMAQVITATQPDMFPPSKKGKKS